MTDAEILARIKGGDVSATGELYDRHARTLFPIALRIVGSAAEAEDLLHDAFVAVHDRASQYEPSRGSVMAWLVTLTRNLAIDRLRRHKRRAAILKQEGASSTVPSDDPERNASDAAAYARVRAAVRDLPDAQRETLEIAFYEGLTYPEIAEREGVPLGTIKSRAARALAALRAVLSEEK